MASINQFLFSVYDYTLALDLIPFQKYLLDELNLFTPVQGGAEQAIFERRTRVRREIPGQNFRGSTFYGHERSKEQAGMVPYQVWAVQHDSFARDSHGKRLFGAQRQETFSDAINQVTIEMLDEALYTRNQVRMRALKGITSIADESGDIHDVFNAFDFWGVTPQPDVMVNLSGADANIFNWMNPITRKIQDVIGGSATPEIYAIAGANFWDGLLNNNSNFQLTQQQWIKGESTDFFANTPSGYPNKPIMGVRMGNVTFYQGLESQGWDPDECVFLPKGYSPVFQTAFGPSSYVGWDNSEWDAAINGLPREQGERHEGYNEWYSWHFVNLDANCVTSRLERVGIDCCTLPESIITAKLSTVVPAGGQSAPLKTNTSGGTSVKS